MIRNVFSMLLASLLAHGAFAGQLGMTVIPSNHPFIQYFGRWDLSDSLRARYSWPGVYLHVEFTGSRVGLRLADGTNYFNVTIDGKPHSVFHGTTSSEANYWLADKLDKAPHTLVFSRRNISFDEQYALSAILLDSGDVILKPSPRPARKIEFIGDSFTAAESNETTEQSLPWEARYPVTNIDKGFAVLIAKHFNAQYTTTCRSGMGLVCDWRGDTTLGMRYWFDRTLMEFPLPKWDFAHWVPDVAVIALGLNDRSGLKDKNGNVAEGRSEMFRNAYHKFLARLRGLYPGVKIVVVAGYPPWLRTNIKHVADEERAGGKTDVYYTQYDEFPNGYVGNGHPTVATHRLMADQIIAAMESYRVFPPEKEAPGETNK